MARSSLHNCVTLVSLAAAAFFYVDYFGHCHATSAIHIVTLSGAKGDLSGAKKDLSGATAFSGAKEDLSGAAKAFGGAKEDSAAKALSGAKAPEQCEWHGPCSKMFQFSKLRAACGDRAVCATSDCLTCRWGKQGPCASPPPSAGRHACPARDGSATAIAGEQELGCVHRRGLQVSPKQQLRGEVLDVVCNQYVGFEKKKGAVNVLIFSLGFDSPMWLNMNPHGLTRFVELHEEWIKMQPPRVQEHAMRADYRTKMSEAWDIRCDYDRLGYFLQANPELRSTCWDIIMVDAPEGFGNGPGRMGSIYAASQLAGPDTVLFVDDCERAVEANYTLWYLSEGRDLRAIDNGHGGVTCMSSPSKA